MTIKKALLGIESKSSEVGKLELEEKNAQIFNLTRRIKRLEEKIQLTNKIKKEIAEFNYADYSRDGAFYFMKKITELFYNAPSDEFERKQFFSKIIKKWKQK